MGVVSPTDMPYYTIPAIYHYSKQTARVPSFLYPKNSWNSVLCKTGLFTLNAKWPVNVLGTNYTLFNKSVGQKRTVIVSLSLVEKRRNHSAISVMWSANPQVQLSKRRIYVNPYSHCTNYPVLTLLLE